MELWAGKFFTDQQLSKRFQREIKEKSDMIWKKMMVLKEKSISLDKRNEKIIVDTFLDLFKKIVSIF